MNGNNYGFMRTGSNDETNGLNINEDEIRQLLSLFVSNSIINASRYAKISKN